MTLIISHISHVKKLSQRRLLDFRIYWEEGSCEEERKVFTFLVKRIFNKINFKHH